MRTLIISDFDGTLAAIRRKPEHARISQKTRRLLERLVDQQHKVVVLSARPPSFLKKQIPRGVEILARRGNRGPRTTKADRTLLRRYLSPIQKKIQHTRISMTSNGVEISYRGHSIDEKKLFQSVQNLARANKLRLFKGRKTIELTPLQARDKKDAILKIAKKWKGPILFFGDDESDAHAAKKLLRRRKVRAYLRQTTERDTTPARTIPFHTIRELQTILQNIAGQKSKTKKRGLVTPGDKNERSQTKGLRTAQHQRMPHGLHRIKLNHGQMKIHGQ